MDPLQRRQWLSQDIGWLTGNGQYHPSSVITFGIGEKLFSGMWYQDIFRYGITQPYSTAVSVLLFQGNQTTIYRSDIITGLGHDL